MRTKTSPALIIAGLLLGGVAVSIILDPAAWQQLLPILARTAATSAAAGSAAAIAGAVLALAYRVGGKTAPLFAFAACVPLIFPSVALATALIQEPFGLDPYGTLIVIIAQAISCLPIAFLIQAAVLATISDDLIMASASLGVSPGATMRRVFRRPWLRSLVISAAVATLFTASDPSVTLVYGGTDSYIASHVLRGMTTGIDWNVGPALIALLAPALLLAVHLTSATQWHSIRESFRRRNPRFVARYFSWRRRIYILAAPVLLILVVTVGIIVQGAFRLDTGRVLSANAVLSTVAVLAFTIPAALGCGLVTAHLARRRGAIGFLIHSAVVLVFLMSQTAIGMLLTAFFRDSTDIGAVNLLPSLVGGGSLGGGYIGVGIAYLSVAAPIAHVGITLMFAAGDDLYDAARDAGADSVRAGAVLLPVLAPQIVTLVALMAGIILTRTAPIIFVQPPGFETASTSLTALAAGGWDERVFAASLIIAMVAAALFIVASGRMLTRLLRGVL